MSNDKTVHHYEPGSTQSAEPESPCVSVCALNEEDLCMGCYRTADEITDWFMANAAQKREILARAAQRREEDNPIQLL